MAEPNLELVLQALLNAEIHFGVEGMPPDGGVTAWMAFGERDRYEKVTWYGIRVGDDPVPQWPRDFMARWFLETAMRLYGGQGNPLIEGTPATPGVMARMLADAGPPAAA